MSKRNPTAAEAADHQDRLPGLTVEVVILLGVLQIERDLHGMLHCHDRSVGALRRKWGRTPKHAALLPDDAEAARDEARILLGEFCRVCPYGECPMKDW